jgi:Na+/melibiose symporter-like transporter
MYGDTFTAGNLGRAAGVRHIVTSSVGITMLFVFLPLADRHEIWPYVGALVFVAIAWGVATFGIREIVPPNLPAPQRYDPLRPLAELRDPHTRNVALVASAVLITLALTEMLHALFVTETLGFSKTVLGLTTTAGFVVSLVCSYPVGWFADRFGPRAVLMAGFALLAGVEAAFFFWVDDLASLYACMIGFKISWLIVHVPIVALIYNKTPPERRGSIFAAVQMTRAAVTSGATVIAGFLADLTGSYRVCYLIAGLVCFAGFAGASRLTSVKRSARVPALA